MRLLELIVAARIVRENEEARKELERTREELKSTKDALRARTLTPKQRAAEQRIAKQYAQHQRALDAQSAITVAKRAREERLSQVVCLSMILIGIVCVLVVHIIAKLSPITTH